MKKTLVLIVDRDDDFGVKGNVETPAIGTEAVMRAVSMLGIADPEDSDINTVYAAIKIYNELREDGHDAEVALICGDTRVGHRSDMRITDELESVIDIVKPDRAVLVSDGAEDEYVYPMVTSRLKVDSVKKVYVKQAPGIESAFYILTRILRDNDKRKRLLAPFGFLLMAIAIVFLFPVFMNYRDSGDMAILYNATGTFVVFAVGLILCIYAFRVGEWFLNYVKTMLTKLKKGDPTVIFSILAIVLIAVGVLIGLTAASNHGITTGQRIFVFISNAFWVIAFAYICNDFGKFLERYMDDNKITLGFMVGTLMIFSAAFIVQGSLDILGVMLNYDIMVRDVLITEFAIGFAFMTAAILTQVSYKRFLNSRRTAEQSDAPQ